MEKVEMKFLNLALDEIGIAGFQPEDGIGIFLRILACRIISCTLIIVHRWIYSENTQGIEFNLIVKYEEDSTLIETFPSFFCFLNMYFLYNLYFKTWIMDESVTVFQNEKKSKNLKIVCCTALSTSNTGCVVRGSKWEWGESEVFWLHRKLVPAPQNS